LKKKIGVATIKDVAKAAKVSTTTVSIVLNKKKAARNISPETRKRIFKAAKDLNYYPNIFAQSLRLGKNLNIAIITFDIGPYCTEIIEGIEKIICAHKYFPIIFDLKYNKNHFNRINEILGNGNFAGAVLIEYSPQIEKDKRILFSDRKVQLVGINFPFSQKFNIPSISIDFEKGSYEAVNYLTQLGHRNIGFIFGPEEVVDYQDRKKGILRALKEKKLPIRNLNEHSISIKELLMEKAGPAAGYDAMKKLLSKNKNITAVCAFDDIAAIGAIKAIREYGLKIPNDISIVGFDNIPLSSYTDPPITTVNYNIVDLGKKAAKLLVEKLKSPKKNPVTEEIKVQTNLVVRESCASPKTNLNY